VEGEVKLWLAGTGETFYPAVDKIAELARAQKASNLWIAFGPSNQLFQRLDTTTTVFSACTPEPVAPLQQTRW
jgi:hypothetical protein